MSEPTWGPVQLEGDWMTSGGAVVDPSLGTAEVIARRQGDIITIECTFSVSSSGSTSIYFTTGALPDEYWPQATSSYSYTEELTVDGELVGEQVGVTKFSQPASVATSPMSPGLTGATATLRYLGRATDVPPNPPEGNPALEELNELLQTLPGFATLTETMKSRALDGAVVPDDSGVWPGETGYVATYDVYFAAMTLLEFLKARPLVRSSSSEGTSVSVDAPDWNGLMAYYRSLSRIAQAAGSTILQRVDIPEGPHVVPTDMSGRWNGYDDVDTDLG